MNRIIKHSFVRQLLARVQQNRKSLAVLVGAFLLIRINKALSRRVRNNGIVDKYDWSREIVLITGGSSGIGDCVIKRLSGRGIKVIILDVNPPPQTHPRVHFFKCDITSKQEVDAIAKEIYSSIGSPTVLINNAGIVRNASILTKSKSDLDATFAVNTYSHFWTVQAFVPAMIQRNHGHIITISSLAAFLSTPNVADYNMSKSAATSFHESLGVELKHVEKADRVRTSLVQPAYVKTPFHAQQAFGTERNPMLKNALEADDVAKEIESVVLSGESRTITVPSMLSHVAGARGWSEWSFRRLLDTCAVAAMS